MAIKVGHQVAVNIGFGFNHHGYITRVDNALEAVQVTLETGEIHVVPWTMVKARRGRPKTAKGLQTPMPGKAVAAVISPNLRRGLDEASKAEMAWEIRGNFEPSDAEEMIKRFCR